MYSHVGQFATKFCQFCYVELFRKKACARNLFYKKIVTKNTTPDNIKSNACCNLSAITSNKLHQTPNIFQSAFRRLWGITELLRNKVLVRKYSWNPAPAANTIELISQGHTVAPVKNFLRSSTSNVHILTRTFATSSLHNNYDFPILPLPTKSRSLQQIRKNVQPIAPSFMPSTISSGTRSKSEKAYRRIRNTCKTLVTDLMYSFPFNTHSEKTKELVPKLPIGEPRNHSVKLISEKLAPKPRNSIWSITENFSFPNIHRRFEMESLATAREYDDNNNEDSTATSASIAEI